MKLKTIKKIIPAHKINMAGHLMDQALPNKSMEQLDPFLLIHHAAFEFRGNQKSKEVGIGPHPHRGFSPVTFIYEGELRHQDSFGHDQTIGAGGTQWMHAGKGITHSERPSESLAQKGGRQEIIQFWVNTPAKYKMETPYYLPLTKEETPKLKEELYNLDIIAGNYKGIAGPANTFSPMLIMRGYTQPSAQFSINIPSDYNTLIYLLDGKLDINGEEAYKKDLIWFANDDEEIQISAVEKTSFIVLSGEPIGESVTSYGPFVMNSQTEILQAMRDSQMGKMGILIENFE